MSHDQPPIPADVPYFRGAWLVLGRELKAALASRTGRLALVVAFLAAGAIFAGELGSGADLRERSFLGRLPFVLAGFAPVTAMLFRLEERSSRAAELWRALPLEPAQVRLGKLGAALAFYGAFLAGALPFVLTLLALDRTGLADAGCGYLGAAVLGGLILWAGSVQRTSP